MKVYIEEDIKTMDELINTHLGANGHDIKIYKDYIIHSCDWKNGLTTVIAPIKLAKIFRQYKFDFTVRSNKPNLHVKPINDKNSEISVFSFLGMNCSPFKKVNENGVYDLRPFINNT